MGAIFRREFKSYMTNMYGIVFVFFILVFAGVFFFMYNLMYMIPQFEYSMIDIQMILIIAVPVLAMRSMAEDRHNGTDRFLLSLPLKMSGIVMGKYFAMLAVFALPVAVMCTFPLILSLFGEVYFLTTYSSIFAFFLLGAFLLAICMYISSLTDNQIIAAVLGVTVILVLYFSDFIAYLIPSSSLASYISFLVIEVIIAAVAFAVSKNINVALIVAAILIIPTSLCYIFLSSSFEGLFAKAVAFISPFTRFNYFTYGIFDLSSIIYFLSVTAFFIFLTVQSLDKKRWG